MTRALAIALALAALGCASAPPGDVTTSLSPDPNPITPADPLWSPQPHRDRPRAICATRDGRKAWVMLGGVEDAPGEDVAVVDLRSERVVKRITLGRSPWGCALDPSERLLVVTLRTSDRAVVLDTETDAEVARVPVPFYTESALWYPDGHRVVLANRWKDAVLSWDVDTTAGFRVLSTSYDGVRVEDPMGAPVGDNPGPMALSADGRRLFVGTVAGCHIAVLDAATLEPVDVDGDPATTTIGAPAGITWIDSHSPVGGMAVWGRWLFVSDIGKGMGQEPDRGNDLDEDGLPGDATANVVFQDLNNEIAVIDTQALTEVRRYTSDSMCCHDYRDVDPDQPERGLLLPAPDTWTPDVVAWLPPKDRWIVAGALPEAMALDGDTLWVVFPGSNEVQGFRVAADGTLSKRPGPTTLATGYNPKALAVAGRKLVTVDRLAEALSVFDLDQEAPARREVVVGDVSEGRFPSTDAELGEGINEMTAIFGIDGDQTCVHCHRDNGAIARPIIMPLQVSRLHGVRNVMAQRGLYDTRPWFFESAMTEENFFPVLNEFTRKENFCCEELDPTVWSKYPKPEECAKDASIAGCEHVLHCATNPPPECAARPYARTPFLKRADFIRDAARRLFGRDTTFGDALWREALDGSRQPIPLDFEGITRAIGLFMLRTPRLLPNPNRWLDLPTARRGKALYQDPAVGCAMCHPLPTTTTATLPEPYSPFGAPVRFPNVISPTRTPEGADANVVTKGFLDTFPTAVQTEAGLFVGATPLRGLWDRPETRLYHDGRGRSLREALATPGHPGCLPGETGRNERDGIFDTHGGTSHLDRYQLDDLIAYLLTL